MTYDVFDACFWKGTSKAQLFGFVFKGTLSVSGSRYDKVAEFSSYFDFDRWEEFEDFFDNKERIRKQFNNEIKQAVNEFDQFYTEIAPELGTIRSAHSESKKAKAKGT